MTIFSVSGPGRSTGMLIEKKNAEPVALPEPARMRYIFQLLNLFYQFQNLKNMENNLNAKPLHDRVIVKPAEQEQMSAGGIIIPDTAKEKPQRGVIVAAGPGKKDEPVTVKPGDTVLYGKYSGTEIKLNGEDLLIMRESDILAIV